MSDHNIEKLKQIGKIYFWRYKSLRQGLLGWHSTADKTGCKFIIDLIQLMLDSKYSSKYKFQLSEAEQKIVSVPNFKESWLSARILLLNHPKNKVENIHWKLDYSGSTITLTVGSGKLKELQMGFTDILNGEGDYEIGNKSEDDGFYDSQLWFWWKR